MGQNRSGQLRTGARHLRVISNAYHNIVLPDKAKATQDLHDICISRLVKSFGHMNPSKIAANRQVSAMGCVFNLGIRKGLLSINPCRQVSRNPEKPRDRYIEDAEFQSVKALASEQMQAIMDFAYMTAMRRGDVLSLRVDKIRDDGIGVRQGKTEKRQFIEWTPSLLEWVERLKTIGPPLRPTLVCTKQGKQYTQTASQSCGSVWWQRL
jgi:integrase